MKSFLSEEIIFEHKEYLRQMKLKYSILEKSIKGVKERDFEGLRRMRLSARDRKDVMELYADIRLHEIYFSSFSEEGFPHSDYVSRKFGSEAVCLNRMYSEAMHTHYGFVAITYTKRGLEVVSSAEPVPHFFAGEPILSLDVSEHAYFRDYGFSKERYVKNALSCFNLSLVDEYISRL